MLDRTQHTTDLMTTAAPATETTALVENGDDFFAKAGRLSAAYDDLRQFPRYYFRSCAEATIYPFGGQNHAEPLRCLARTRDLSRSGLGVLVPCQLFPGQRLEIVLNDQSSRLLEVMWCRCVGRESYLCGCKFAGPVADEPAA